MKQDFLHLKARFPRRFLRIRFFDGIFYLFLFFNNIDRKAKLATNFNHVMKDWGQELTKKTGR